MREMRNRKHDRIVSRFDPLALCPCLHHNEGFQYKRFCKITRCRNTYNELP